MGVGGEGGEGGEGEVGGTVFNVSTCDRKLILINTNGF